MNVLRIIDEEVYFYIFLFYTTVILNNYRLINIEGNISNFN